MPDTLNQFGKQYLKSKLMTTVLNDEHKTQLTYFSFTKSESSHTPVLTPPPPIIKQKLWQKLWPMSCRDDKPESLIFRVTGAHWLNHDFVWSGWRRRRRCMLCVRDAQC